MASWFIALISAEYLLAALFLAGKGNYGLALFALGCTIANIGLMIASK